MDIDRGDIWRRLGVMRQMYQWWARLSSEASAAEPVTGDRCISIFGHTSSARISTCAWSTLSGCQNPCWSLTQWQTGMETSMTLSRTYVESPVAGWCRACYWCLPVIVKCGGCNDPSPVKRSSGCEWVSVVGEMMSVRIWEVRLWCTWFRKKSISISNWLIQLHLENGH